MITAPRIVYADPRGFVREAVTASLSADYGVDVVAGTGDVVQTLLQVERTEPDVVVIAAALGEGVQQLCRDLRSMEARPRILIIDGAASLDRLLQGIEAGADGYLNGGAGLTGLHGAVRALAAGESVVPPHMLGPLLRRLIDRRRDAFDVVTKLDRLTPREREVLGLLVDGLDHHEAARHLVLSPETVRTHIQRILRKLEVHSRLEAIALVARTGSQDRLDQLVTGRAS